MQSAKPSPFWRQTIDYHGSSRIKKILIQVSLFILIALIFLACEGVGLNLAMDTVPRPQALCFFLVVGILLMYYLLEVPAKSLDTIPDKQMNARDFRNAIFLGFSLIIVVNLLINLISPEVDPENQQKIIELWNYFDGSIWFIIYISILGPIIEELLLRKYFISYLCRGKIWGYALSAFLFAYLHVIDDIKNIYAYLGMSVIICFIYYRYRNIWVNIGLHILVNSFSVLALYLLQSGVLDGLSNA
ncbi:CPBP family intramembrane glutamic endopeptidase [Psittacicella hinzii]|uniref:CAAX prenyl protease 2/Lysostaphin resistance protein A-like domain-containing protein n=1 Tax=Psittacicella hinzii TaxID=2028575 RepID=A0A3A1YNA1_9GAMM|nr:type II CAAX endopeptidase family protein [Psittacicella hinzii]RIY39031.1 hypothetical protein CKF58_02905 [Psittacicella hinzii]